MLVKIKFSELNINDIFCCNGNLCKKISSKTALLIDYDKKFYFSQNVIVKFIKKGKL